MSSKSWKSNLFFFFITKFQTNMSFQTFPRQNKCFQSATPSFRLGDLHSPAQARGSREGLACLRPCIEELQVNTNPMNRVKWTPLGSAFQFASKMLYFKTLKVYLMGLVWRNNVQIDKPGLIRMVYLPCGVSSRRRGDFVTFQNIGCKFIYFLLKDWKWLTF